MTSGGETTGAVAVRRAIGRPKCEGVSGLRAAPYYSQHAPSLPGRVVSATILSARTHRRPVAACGRDVEGTVNDRHGTCDGFWGGRRCPAEKTTDYASLLFQPVLSARKWVGSPAGG